MDFLSILKKKKKKVRRVWGHDSLAQLFLFFLFVPLNSCYQTKAFIIVAEEGRANKRKSPAWGNLLSKAVSLGGEFWHRQSCLQFGFFKMYPASLLPGRGRGWSSDHPHPCAGAVGLRSQLRRNFQHTNPLLPAHAGCSPPPPPKRKSPPPPPAPTARRESLVFAAKIKSKWKGKIRRFRAEQPDSSREGKKPSPRGLVKVNFKVMQIVMQRKFPFCARRERSSSRRARGAGSLGRGGGGVTPGASCGAGPEEGSRRGPQDAFGAIRLAGCRKRARSEPGSFSTRPTLPRNGSPRRTSEPARERCC